MFQSKFYSLVKENLFTDLVLTLKDDTNEITMNVHKNVLYVNCPYFEKLLTNCKEKNSNDIVIKVPNMYVAYDIIMEFYGQETNLGNLPPRRHLLEIIKCRDFWGLEFDSITGIRVPPEGFELLLNVIELMGYNDDTIRAIIKNLPPDYDLSMFPNELINEMTNIMQKHIIIAGTDEGINIWDVNTGELIRTLGEHNDHVYSVHYSLDNNRIISGNYDNHIKIWDANTGELIRTLYGYSNIVCSVCYSSDNKRIIAGSWDQSIKIWNAITGELIRTLNGHNGIVRSVCYSSDNKKIISGSSDNSIKIWDAATGELIRTLNGHDDCVCSVYCSSDNKRIISGSWDNSIKIWNADTGKLMQTLNGHNNSVSSVCYSPDNKRIVSGSWDYNIKIWDADSGELIRTLYGHKKSVRSVCYSSDNKRIISGGDDKSIKIWDADTGELIRTLEGPPKVGNDVSNFLGAPSNFVLGQSYRGHGKILSVCSSRCDDGLTERIKNVAL